MVIALLGMPFAWPAYLAMGVVGGLASFVTGKKVARFVCSRDRIEELRTTFLKTTEQEIGGQIRAQVPQFEARLQTHVKESFEALKAHLSKELGGPITETQRTLDELNERQVRDSAQREMELRDLAATRKAAEQIYARAAARSNELRDVVSV